MYIANMAIKTAFRVANPKQIAKIMEHLDIHGWITAGLFREMKRLEGHAAFKHVGSKFNFMRCVVQGSVEAPTLRLKLAKQILWNVEKERMRKRMETHIDKHHGGWRDRRICNFCGPIITVLCRTHKYTCKNERADRRRRKKGSGTINRQVLGGQEEDEEHMMIKTRKRAEQVSLW